MSQENVEIVRESWNAWSEADMERLFALYDPEIVWDMTHFRDWPESTYRGVEGVQRFLSEWLEVWDKYEVGVDQIVPALDGRVVSLAWQRGVGHQSGIAMEIKWAMIATVRSGRILKLENYDDRSKALKAVGLSE